jgi:hypothetical protein
MPMWAVKWQRRTHSRALQFPLESTCTLRSVLGRGGCLVDGLAGTGDVIGRAMPTYAMRQTADYIFLKARP